MVEDGVDGGSFVVDRYTECDFAWSGEIAFITYDIGAFQTKRFLNFWCSELYSFYTKALVCFFKSVVPAVEAALKLW